MESIINIFQRSWLPVHGEYSQLLLVSKWLYLLKLQWWRESLQGITSAFHGYNQLSSVSVQASPPCFHVLLQRYSYFDFGRCSLQRYMREVNGNCGRWKNLFSIHPYCRSNINPGKRSRVRSQLSSHHLTSLRQISHGRLSWLRRTRDPVILGI